jgi:hypothetical protein
LARRSKVLPPSLCAPKGDSCDAGAGAGDGAGAGAGAGSRPGQGGVSAVLGTASSSSAAATVEVSDASAALASASSVKTSIWALINLLSTSWLAVSKGAASLDALGPVYLQLCVQLSDVASEMASVCNMDLFLPRRVHAAQEPVHTAVADTKKTKKKVRAGAAGVVQEPTPDASARSNKLSTAMMFGVAVASEDAADAVVGGKVRSLSASALLVV